MSLPVEQLLLQPEGKTLEFKRDLSSPHNVLKTLVALLIRLAVAWSSG